MIDAGFATAVVLGLIALFGVGLPILNHVAPKYVSYRWSVVVVMLALLVGVVVDFAGLDDDVRRIVATGTLIICGAYLVLRTLEKALANGWLRGVRLDVRKGDASATLSSDSGQHNEPG